MFDGLANQVIEWKRSDHGDRLYELRAGSRVLATLRRESWLGALATGTVGACRWTLRRAGLFPGKVVMRAMHRDVEDAVCRSGWTGAGDIELGNGRSFAWRRRGFMSPEWAFMDESRRPLMIFRPGLGAKAAVEITSAGARTEEAPMLAVLGGYLMVLIANDPDGVATPVGGG